MVALQGLSTDVVRRQPDGSWMFAIDIPLCPVVDSIAWMVNCQGRAEPASQLAEGDLIVGGHDVFDQDRSEILQ